MAAGLPPASRRLRRLLPVAVLVVAGLLGGCVAYPAEPGYQYGYGCPPYYGSPVEGLVVGGGWGWGWHGGGWHGDRWR